MGRPSLTWASLRWNAASLSALSWQHSPLAATGTLGPARSRQLAHTDYYKPHRASVQSHSTTGTGTTGTTGTPSHSISSHATSRRPRRRLLLSSILLPRREPGSTHQDSFDRRVFSEENSSSSVLSRPPRSCARLQLLEAMLTAQPHTTPSWLRQIRKQVQKDNHTPMQRHTIKLAQPSITGDQ